MHEVLLWPYNDPMHAADADPLVYLDHAATTPVLPAVADAMHEATLRYSANPASQHGPGRAARRALERARRRIGQLLGADVDGRDADCVIFTSGGTEANNLALAGLGERRATLVISAAEHPSVSVAAEQQHRNGRPVETLPIGSDGIVALDRLESILARGEVGLVSVQLANNESGVVQPIEKIALICARHNVAVHTDAVQAVGNSAIRFSDLGVASLTCAAHKFHGPLGVGVLVVKANAVIEPLLVGGHQQQGVRPGTESVGLAVGMAAALEASAEEGAARGDRIRGLRDRFESAVLTEFRNAVVIGATSKRVPHIANIAFRGIDRQAFAMALDLAGVACSTGSACASGSSEPSPTLRAMGFDEELISGSLRFSLGATTTAQEIDLAVRRISSVGKQLRSST